MDDDAVRTIVDIPDEVIASLDRLGEKQKKSRAALIREAVSRFLEETAHPPVEAAFGIWKETPVDGMRYQAGLRREWDDR